jgi:hypothetical protein
MAQPQTLDPLLTTHTVHQFPLPTWIENLAVRSNGQILLTILTKPELYLLDPSNPEKVTLVHTFSEVGILSGIVEVEDDVFYVAGGNYSLDTFKAEHGSGRIWEVDMKSFDTDSKATIKEIAHLPGSGLLNGMEVLKSSENTILLADSEVGCVWKVNVKDGKVEKVIDIDEMKPPPPPEMQLGINGLKVRDGYLYWTNTAKQLFCRVTIDEDGKAHGDPQILETGTLVDDFIFDNKGNAWLAQHALNVIGVVKVGGGVITVAGKTDELTIAGSTACQFGRKGDEHILYVATCGALSFPVDGKVEGGKVVAVDTSKFHY